MRTIAAKIWLTSDLHFNHDREFIWKARGFTSVSEMNEEIIRRFNSVVGAEDTLYILGDAMLGGQDLGGLDMIMKLNGNKIIIAGNHDTNSRVASYRAKDLQVYDALRLNHRGYHFYLSHYPTITSNLEKESLKQCTLNLFGHTHQTCNFYNDMPFMYHVGVDSHDCYPIEIDAIIEEMKEKVNECVAQL